MAAHGQRRSGWALAGIGAVWAVCFGVIAVVGVGLASTLGEAGKVPETALVTNPPPDSVTLSRSTPTPTVDTRDVPVNPWCWSSRDAAETAKCQEQVAKTTKFVNRYQTHQAALAEKHTIVKAGPTGTREANSLARHGLLICWMTKEDRVSLEKMVMAFTFAMHPHQYTLPDPSGGRWSDAQRQFYAATQIHTDALQTICPSLADEYEAKGGPVIADLA